MCDPTGLIAAEVVTGLAGQTSNANAAREYRDANFEANKASADANAIRNYAALQTRQKQEIEASNQSIENASREALAARGTSRTSAGESGVAGNSIAALDQEFVRAQAEFESRAVRSQAYLNEQFSNQAAGVRSGQEAQIRSGIGDPIEQPDFLNAIVRGFSKAWYIKHTTSQNKETE